MNRINFDLFANKEKLRFVENIMGLNMEFKSGVKIYSLKEMNEKQKVISQTLQENMVHPVLADLYAMRGVENFSDVNLIQKLEHYDNLLGAREAAKILSKAILKKDKICVVADYDVDGATACAIAVRGIKMFGGNIDYVVPNRFIHGYGLTVGVVEEVIKKKNPDLIITVDNGISSYEGVDYAKSKGVEVLITDHHLPAENMPLPNAVCIVNPNQKGCGFKSKSLAGCGVMYYVLAALREHMVRTKVYSEESAPNIHSLLDLVAVGTIADVVKLDLNNRILVHLGLKQIRRNRTKPGIIAIAEMAKRDIYKLSTMDIGFGLGPRINAAGRLEDMTIGINCLLTDSLETAKKLAEKLNTINVERKELETKMKETALEARVLMGGDFIRVAYDESFHEGVIGIVASRLKEDFYRPTIVFAPSSEDGLIKGSGRSIPELHLRDALDYVHKKDPQILIKFGGHAAAAGLTIKKENLNNFVKLFDEAVQYFVGDKRLVNLKEVDLELRGEFINIETAELIQREVWGQGFPQPLFISDFNILEQKVLKDAHLKLLLEKNNQVFEGIWFFNNKEIEKEKIGVVFSLGVNEFNSNKKVQILIEEIKN